MSSRAGLMVGLGVAVVVLLVLGVVALTSVRREVDVAVPPTITPTVDDIPIMPSPDISPFESPTPLEEVPPIEVTPEPEPTPTEPPVAVTGSAISWAWGAVPLLMALGLGALLRRGNG